MKSARLQSFLLLSLLAACSAGLCGCVAHIDHDHHHDGYYDDKNVWHGGYYDEDHGYHEDPPDWHK